MIDEKMLAMKVEKDAIFAQADQCNEKLREIQLKHHNFNDGKYFPHRNVKKVIKCYAVDHHKEWCDCIYCKEEHDKHFVLIGKALKIYDKIKEYSRELGNIGFFNRGFGKDHVKCFICGNLEEYYNDNISAFVNSKEDGEKIVSWFPYAWLDYRPPEPHYIQVKIGACSTHKPILEKLCKEISWHGTIYPEIVKEVLLCQKQ